MRLFSLRRLEARILPLLLVLSITAFRLFGQSGSSSGGASSNASPSPVGSTLNDSITLSAKGTDASTRSLSFKLSGGWTIGCVANNTVSDGSTAIAVGTAKADAAAVIAVDHPKALDCLGPFTPNWFANNSVEILIAASADYEDSWKEVTSASVISQTYYGAVDFLKGWQPESFRFHRYEGVMLATSETHSSNQLIKFDTIIGPSYFYQIGSLQSSNGKTSTFSPYLLVAGGLAGVAVIPIPASSNAPPPPNQYNAAGTLTFGGRTFFDRAKFNPTNVTATCHPDTQICDPKFEADLSATATLPFSQFTTSVQSYVDGKLTYTLPLAQDDRVKIGLTLETTWTYFGPRPSQGQTNSVTPTLGLTFKFGN